MTLDDIRAGADDDSGRRVLFIYSKVPGRYAVYRTDYRVLIRFSDDRLQSDRQRQLIIPLGPLRSQIEGLVNDWRASSARAPGDRKSSWRDSWLASGGSESSSRVESVDARLAAALTVALEGNAEAAEKLLAKIHFDILLERSAIASVSYVLWASAATAAAVLIACLFTSSQYRLLFDYSTEARALWLGIGAGALGAFFSIVVAARSRSILISVQGWRENRMDAIVRITIGAIAGMLLAGLLQAKLIGFTVGGIGTAGQANGWMLLAFGAFAAGFSERLIPNLLDRSSSTAGGYAASIRPLDAARPIQSPALAEAYDSRTEEPTPQSSLAVEWPRIESAGELGMTRPAGADRKPRRNQTRTRHVKRPRKDPPDSSDTRSELDNDEGAN